MCCLFSLINMFAFGSAAWAQDLDSLKSGVVKITTTTGQTGTGFIVRLEPETVYVMTAAHVIAGDQQPRVEFFSAHPSDAPQTPTTAAVMPGAQVGDDLRGLAVLIVRGTEHFPSNIQILEFPSSVELVSGGERAMVIGHPGGGGDWAVVNRDISNRVVHDITLDPGVAARFSGGPIVFDGRVVGMAMANRGEFGLGITHKSLLTYLEGIGVEPGSLEESVKEEFDRAVDEEDGSSFTRNDDLKMVLIPSGEFIMGSEPNEVCEWDSIMKVDFCLPERNADYSPPHHVQVGSFYMDSHEITVEQFSKFVKETEYQSTVEHQGTQLAVMKKDGVFFGSTWQPQEIEKANWRHPMGGGSSTENTGEKFPVVQVSWFDAQTYCEWAGKRLPTEAEWEYAARAGTSTKHWWGDVAPTEQVGNIPDIQFRSIFSGSIEFEKVDDGFARAAPVGSFSPNPWGLFDMAGNVWEWTSDWYDPGYYQSSPQRDPSGPQKGSEKVKRGGSWFSYLELKVRENQLPEDSDDQTGFRCAKDAS